LALGFEAGNINAYQFEQRIGEGTYGKVYRGVHKRTGFVVAIKALDKGRIKEQRMTEKVNRETNILQLLSDTGNPHVVRLFEFIETESKFYMVMTYCPGGDFFDFLSYRGHVTENEARALFLQILSGVEFCHQHHVVHRDLKPENLLIDAECNVKIADFSLANRVESIGSKDDQFFKPLHTSCGSPNYAAPEIVSGVEYSGFEVDIWSMGVILYSLICGMLPFDDDNPVILFRQIKSGKYPPPPAHVSRDCQQLLAAMMAVDPKKRCSIRQIRQNPWCLSEDFVCNKTIFAYAPLQPPEETLSEDSDEEIGRFLRSSKDKISASGNSLNKSGSIGELADDPADYANKPGEISLYYKSQWTKTFLHHTIKGVDSWMPLPGERMKIPSEGDAIPELSGKEWRFLTVHRDKWGHAGITFAFNDGSGKWDNNGSPFKNYHADLPGTYWIDSATGEVVDVKTRLPVPGVG
jgi:serine/threonine protein kinase